MRLSEIDNIIDIGTSSPTLLRFDVKPKNWFERILQKVGLMPKKRVIEVRPITLRSRLNYSKHVNRFKKHEGSMKSLSLDAFHNLVVEDISEDIVKALAIAIHNENSNPPKWLYDFIWSLNQSELNAILEILRKHLDVEGFLVSIISMTGMSLQANEIIAFDDSTSMNSREILSSTGDSAMKK